MDYLFCVFVCSFVFVKFILKTKIFEMIWYYYYTLIFFFFLKKEMLYKKIVIKSSIYYVEFLIGLFLERIVSRKINMATSGTLFSVTFKCFLNGCLFCNEKWYLPI